MATKLPVIVPSNLGKTIVLNALDTDKWDVKYDPAFFEWTPDGIALKDAVLKPLRDADVASAELKGSDLVLTKVDGTKLTVPLASLVPAAKADKFLKAVSYNKSGKKLVFTVGSDADPATDTIEVAVADLIPVAVGNGLQGDGTEANPVAIKVVSGSGLKATEDGLGVDRDALVELTDGTGKVTLGFIFPKA